MCSPRGSIDLRVYIWITLKLHLFCTILVYDTDYFPHTKFESPLSGENHVDWVGMSHITGTSFSSRSVDTFDGLEKLECNQVKI